MTVSFSTLGSESAARFRRRHGGTERSAGQPEGFSQPIRRQPFTRPPARNAGRRTVRPDRDGHAANRARVAMARMVRDALQIARSGDRAAEVRTRAASTRQFTIAANDFTTMVAGAASAADTEGARRLTIDLVIKPVTRIDLAEQIDLGRIDAAIGIFRGSAIRFKSSLLFEYDDVLIAQRRMRKLGRHRRSSSCPMPLDHRGFIRRRTRGRHRRLHLRTRAGAAIGDVRPGRVRARTVRHRNRSPRIAVSLPHFLALPALLDGSGTGGHRAAAPGRCARPHAFNFDLRAALPDNTSGSPLAMA